MSFPTSKNNGSSRRSDINGLAHVAQTFLSAGSRDFPVPPSGIRDWRLESRQNPQAGKPALRRRAFQSFAAFNQIRRIAWKEFGDRFRSGWVIACVLVWMGAICLTSFFGLLQIGRIGAQGYERTVIGLLNLAQYLIPLLGLLLGHDLIASENEERTLRLILASGVSRTRLMLGKLLGGSLTLAAPLLLGFATAGTLIGLAAKDTGLAPFLKLAGSGLMLGIIFLGIGLAISTLCRTRVRSLVVALLVWCVAVFVFDLIAMSTMLSMKSPAAVQEIELVCDATHVNAAADLHADFDNSSNAPATAATATPVSSPAWIALNPVDLFRALNLPAQVAFPMPLFTTLLSAILWLALPLGVSVWKLRRTDL
jgi:Cu-processing system permease protein